MTWRLAPRRRALISWRYANAEALAQMSISPHRRATLNLGDKRHAVANTGRVYERLSIKSTP